MAIIPVSTAPGQAAAPPPETQARGRRITPYLLLLPGMLWLAIFFVIPLGTLAATSLQVPVEEGNPDAGFVPALDFSNYWEALQEYWPQFVRSFVYAGLATVFCLVIAFPVAYFMAFKAGKWRNLMLILVIAPFFCSFLIRTYAWKTILADEGWVTTTLNALHLLPEDRLLNTPIAVILGITYNFLPFMILPLYASLERMDYRLVEAAGDLYSGPTTVLRKVTMRLAAPGIIAGTLLTFIPACGDYINAALLGSVRDRMIGNVIQAQFLNIRDYPTASALSFILMAAILVLVFVYIRRSDPEDLV